MTTTTRSVPLTPLRVRDVAPARPTRSGMAAALTAFVILLAGAMTATFGLPGLALVAFSLPVPLTLLWLSVDVYRADETPGR